MPALERLLDRTIILQSDHYHRLGGPVSHHAGE